MASQSDITGARGELLAEQFLQQKGFTIIQKNYRIQGGEIDLITQKDGYTVFFEVKTRTNSSFGLPEDAITYHKRRKLLRAMYTYLYDHPAKKWRFDLLALDIRTKVAYIKHYQDIFCV